MKHRAALIFSCLITFFCAHAQRPVANFKSDIDGGCSPIVVNFQDLSTGNPTSWLWDFGNGAFSTLQNPSTTYFAPGKYKVTLSATNASGTHTIFKDAFITVFEEPVAEFRADRRNGCSPTRIQFFDQSTPPPGTTVTGWKWDFGDGESSTERNPQHIYREPGSFTVTLTITNDKGCSKLITKPNYVDIIPGVTIEFFHAQPTVCRAPATIQFTNNSSGPGNLSYQWNFGNGRTSTAENPSTVYTTDGKFTPSLIVTSSVGCTDTLRMDSAVVIGGIVTNFTIPDICPNNEVQFFDSSSLESQSSLWKFSDGSTDFSQNPYKIFAAAGTYDVQLINTYSFCTDSVTRKVVVAPIATTDFTSADTGSCKAPLTVRFQNKTKDGVSYRWEFGDGGTSTEANPTHTYTTEGSFTVKLISFNASGCTDTLVKTNFIRIEKPKIATINLPQRGCIPYLFNAFVSFNTPDTVKTYQWNFGDGGTSTEAAPSYTYQRQGTYDITLTVTTKGGCTETFVIQKAVKVGTKPVADFNFDKTNVCASDAIQFTDISVPADEWKWDFGDGESSIEKNPLHTFLDIGTLKVKLTAYNSGCGDDITKEIVVKAPVAKFSFAPNCNNRLEYTFTDKSILANTWFWEFGDGSTFTGQTPPPHTFPGKGTYNVALTVTNGSCSFRMVREVVIQDFAPAFSTNINLGCKPVEVQFIPANAGDKRIKTYSWNFGDGSTEDAAGLTEHIYTTAGSFDATLTTIDTFGCKDVNPVPQRIRVNGPTAKFSSITNQGCKGMTTTFIDESTTDGVNHIASWTFDFGDGTVQTFTAPPFTHVYDKVGRFTVKMIVRDAAGCADSISSPKNFIRTSSFRTNFSVTKETCPGTPITFYSVTNTRNYTTTWDFGNGVTANENFVTYAYPDTGSFTIKMVITDTLGCKDSLTREQYLQVYRPIADFTANNFSTYCTPFEAKFTNQSTYYNVAIWDLGIGTSNQFNPVSYYTNTGSYDVKLKVFSHGGCADSVTKSLRVYNPSDGKLTYNPQVGGCRPFPVNFEAFTEMNASFVWDFGDGTVIDTTINQIRHVYDNFGNFLPKIILKEPSGCLVPLTGSDTIQIIGAKADFEVNRNLFCDSGLLVISDSSRSREPITEYLWNYGDGTTSTSFVPPSHYYSSPGNYPVSLVLKTESGCTDTMRLEPPVKVVQSPLISILGDSSVCLNEFNSYVGSIDREDTSALKWRWVFGNGNTSEVQDPMVQQYVKPGDVTITAVATNSSGCTHTVTKNIFVNPLPTAILPSTLTTQVGFPIPIPITYAPNVVSYNWSPSVGLSCTTCPQPEAGPKYNTKYSVTYIDSNECRNTSEVQVIVLCKNANVFVPNTFSPNGDGVNDMFYVRGKGLDRVKSLRIFNRWGEVVFEKKDFAVNEASVGWDGRYRGTRAMSGVYIYQVEVFCENSEIIRFEGNITLIQ